ncbi:MAG: protease inhibitor I42 family protein [Chlamydiota bacterium]
MSRIQISSADNGKSLAVRVGDELAISLPENPTTGYRWQVDSSGSSLILEKDDFALPGKVQMGSGGTRLLTFRAAAAGHASLQLGSRRPWEEDKPALQSFSLSIQVEPRS